MGRREGAGSEAAEVRLATLALHVARVVVGVAACAGAFAERLEVHVRGDLAVDLAVHRLLDADLELRVRAWVSVCAGATETGKEEGGRRKRREGAYCACADGVDAFADAVLSVPSVTEKERIG